MTESKIPMLIYRSSYHLIIIIFSLAMDFILRFQFLLSLHLSSFKLYCFYFYTLFAIVTWILFIGSLSQYFDSAFNGFHFQKGVLGVYLSTIIKCSSADCCLFDNITTLNMNHQSNNTSKYHRITLRITITDTPTCTYSRYYPANGACRYFKFSLWRYKKLTVAD